jgi:aerobic carbon-monoxide dehydrogenase small subunit
MNTVTVTINGATHTHTVESRKILADFIREDCGLTGTHLGCEHGVCGSCTILLDGEAVRSCLLFAAQVEGASLTTIEGLSPRDGSLSVIQQAFMECHGLQCGFCTPGFVVSAHAFLEEHPDPDQAEVREALSGNLCRCTGYQGIVRAVMLAATRLNDTTAVSASAPGSDDA